MMAFVQDCIVVGGGIVVRENGMGCGVSPFVHGVGRSRRREMLGMIGKWSMRHGLEIQENLLFR